MNKTRRVAILKHRRKKKKLKEKGKAEKCFRADINAQKVLITIMGLCFFYFSNEYTMKELVGGISMTPAGLDKQIRHVCDIILNGIRNRD